MDTLGHERFAVVGHDIGLVISYALAADDPDRVDRAVLLEVPGPPTPTTHRRCSFRLRSTQAVAHPLQSGGWCGRAARRRTGEGLLRLRVHHPGRPPARGDVDYYVGLVSTPDALPGSFVFYRAWDATMAQNGDRAATPLTMPILAIGGEASWGPAVGGAMGPLANDVQTVVIPGASHWVAEEAPDELLDALAQFLAPFGAMATASG